MFVVSHACSLSLKAGKLLLDYGDSNSLFFLVLEIDLI